MLLSVGGREAHHHILAQHTRSPTRDWPEQLQALVGGQNPLQADEHPSVPVAQQRQCAVRTAQIQAGFQVVEHGVEVARTSEPGNRGMPQLQGPEPAFDGGLAELGQLHQPGPKIGVLGLGLAGEQGTVRQVLQVVAQRLRGIGTGRGIDEHVALHGQRPSMAAARAAPARRHCSQTSPLSAGSASATAPDDAGLATASMSASSATPAPWAKYA